MIGAIIGAGISAASSIFGGIKNRQAMEEYAQNIEDQKNNNQAWYDRRYNEDPLSRAGAQAVMTAVADQIKRNNNAAYGRQAVIGGTEESTAATKEANADALAQTAGKIVAADDARKDNIESQYLNTKQSLEQQRNNLNYQRAQNVAAAVKGAGAAAGSIASSIDAPTDAQPAAQSLTGVEDALKLKYNFSTNS